MARITVGDEQFGVELFQAVLLKFNSDEETTGSCTEMRGDYTRSARR